jgi:uncharacterized protein
VIRAVLDGNVFASALINAGGPPGKLIRLWVDRAFEVVLSGNIVAEVERVVRYAKVRRYIRLTDEQIDLGLVAVQVLAIPVSPSAVPRVVPDDLSDDVYFAAALEGRATHIVSGDAHLVDVGTYQSVEVVKPGEFLALVDKA